MGKHTVTERGLLTEGGGSRAEVRNISLAMIALTLFVIAMIASYSGAFAKPTLHHMAVAVAGPEQLVDAIRGQEALAVTEVDDADAARQQVYERKTDAAFVVAPNGQMTIYVAGGGRSVANAAETVGRGIAANAGLQASAEDIAPHRSATRRAPSSSTPSSSSRSGRRWAPQCSDASWAPCASTPPWRCAPFRWPDTRRCSPPASPSHVDTILGALTGHGWQVFGALWLCAMAVGGAGRASSRPSGSWTMRWPRRPDASIR